MKADRFWHPKMIWYGPVGIGTSRGFKGFRDWHQIPFLAGMPDRGSYPTETATSHFLVMVTMLVSQAGPIWCRLLVILAGLE